MLDDLSAAYYLEPSITDQNPTAVFIGRSALGADSFSTAQPLLRFTTLGHRRWQPDSAETDLSLVEYHTGKDPESGLLSLIHREETNPLSTTEASIEEYDLIEGLKDLRLRFFDGADWSESWDSTLKKDLPQAVEVKFILPIEDEDREFGFLARIPAAKPFVSGVIKPTGNARP
jgi:hypothetical protein